MDDEEIIQSVEDETGFWHCLETIVSAHCESHEHIDDALRKYLTLITTYTQQYLQDENDHAICCYKLLDSQLFVANKEYVRRQFLYCLLQDDDASTLQLAATVCLFDGRNDECVFEKMQAEGTFARLIELITLKPEDNDALHRLLLQLLYEMSRVHKLQRDDLAAVSDGFILYLFQLIEAFSDDADDPYHYPVIRVILVLNEQYMCFASTAEGTPALTNRVLKLLSAHGPSYRTFGENLILLLNRESALGPQLLILKLLYLLFTTPPTYEYFYTNDLHVLVDVVIRNLLDLDLGNYEADDSHDDFSGDGQRALRHTYLRVLYPLLKNTQLARGDDQYKREELRKLLDLLTNHSSAHFAPADETIFRLVLRCKQIAWLKNADDPEDHITEKKLAEVTPSHEVVAEKLLGMSLTEAGDSSLSVLDVSARLAKERPSVPAPRRKNRKPIDTHALRIGTVSLSVPESGSEVLDSVQDKERSPFADESDEH